MDFKQALVQVYTHPWIKKLPPTSLVASTLAAVIHQVLSAVDFGTSAAITELARVGFKVSTALMPSIIEASKKGIEALGDWLEREIAKKPEVNEAAARTMIEQAEKVAQTIEGTHPDDKEEMANMVGEGLNAYGGAVAEIAEQYAIAIKDTAELSKLVEQMKARVEIWASQSIVAKRGSLIESVEMNIKGKGGKQEIRAEDDSIISGAKQIINDRD